nr:immunoglobulin light chain junction region [Mus musculus]
CQQINSWPLTF